MSLLTPEKLPVKVYKWDDVGAPVLDKTVGCVATIFKACLAVGYGTKESAGWTMQFEDTAARIKVLRPEVGPHTDFYLRLSADTGTEMLTQVYLNMTDVSTGDLKLQCATPFKYAKKNSTGKWVLVASSRGFWFFCEQRTNVEDNPSKTGSYFFVGDVLDVGRSDRAVYMQHTGGTYNITTDYSSILGFSKDYIINKSPDLYVRGQLLTPVGAVMQLDAISLFNGHINISNTNVLAPLLAASTSDMYVFPGIFTSSTGSVHNNFDVVDIANGQTSQSNIVFGMSASNAYSNFYISTDYWSY